MPPLSYQQPGLVVRRPGTGATDSQIRDLQRHLRALGYLRQGIDGQFGPGTEFSVKALQHDLLHNDGRGSDGQAPVNNYGMGAVSLRNTAKTDGAIYHQIVAGGSLMPAHADRVRPDDRWRVILYLRSLQGKYDEK